MIAFGGRILVHNAAALVEQPQGVTFWRVPADVRDHLNPKAQERLRWTTGVELRFRRVETPVRVTLSVDEGTSIAEVYYGPFWHSMHFIGTEPTTFEVVPLEWQDLITSMDDLPFGLDVVRVLLPWGAQTVVHAIEGDLMPPDADQLPRLRYLAYGSSITNGNAGGRPTGMYAAHTARLLGADLYNLGSGGSAFFEPELADHIATRDDWNISTLEIGINMIDPFSEDEFAERVHYFVNRVASANPQRWVFCIDTLLNFRDAPTHPQHAKCLAFRRIVREAVAAANQPRCVHVDALSLMDSPRDLRSDALHPSPSGAEVIAARLAATIKQHLEAEMAHASVDER